MWLHAQINQAINEVTTMDLKEDGSYKLQPKVMSRFGTAAARKCGRIAAVMVL